MRKPDLARWERYFGFRNQGIGVEQAARRAHLASSTAYRFEKGDQTSTGLEAAAILGITHIGDNLIDQPINDQAKQALDDFAYFRLRYLGRKSTPWQERAAYEMIRLLDTAEREYVITNMPPGAGKSTLFTHDIPVWLIARDRSIRIMIGARTERQARMYVGRIKRTLEREAPLRAKAKDLEASVAWDAEATLLDDYTAFRPEGRSEKWRADELVVRQLDGTSIDDKEPTVAAYGQDSGFLGGRFDVVIWDDLVDKQNTVKTETRDSTREWWDTEAETRLEPGGVLLLQGQRIRHDDLYRYCLDMREMDQSRKYRHIIYKAHDDDKCVGHDNPDRVDEPWPNGCLLDPYRLPHRMLESLRLSKPRVFDVQYQQNDGEKVGGLVQEAWIKGGTDDDGIERPGCLDVERTMGVIPSHLADSNFYSFVTVDPSPTEFWGVIWWVYSPLTQERYIVDIKRDRMNPEDFLSLNLDTNEYSGLMVDWRHAAITAGFPIVDATVEVNAAQRWLLRQPHVQRWMQITGITFIPHTTTIKKQDPLFGFESIGDLFRQGKIRIPYGSPMSRMRANDLMAEALNYPDAETDDLLMSTWFAKLAVENWTPPRYEAPTGAVYDSGARRGMYAYSR
jgi:hypothetical protein